MENNTPTKEPTVRVVKLSQGRNFWKFFGVFVLGLCIGAAFYLISASDTENETMGGNNQKNSFFSSVGDSAKEAVSDIFTSGEKQKPKEVINLKSDDSVTGIERENEDFLDGSDLISDSETSGSQNTENYLLCDFETSEYPSKEPVIINEVAWMGGNISPSDEWIELKNTSGVKVDIDGWQLVDMAEQIQTVLFGDIDSKGFYLLERSDDNSVPDHTADTIYSGALSNSKEGLRLFNKNCILVDEVFADLNWPAGDSSKRLTMQRGQNLDWSTSVSPTPGFENGDSLENEEENSADLSPDNDEAEEDTPSEEESQPPEENPQDFSPLKITNVIFDVEGSDKGNERVTISNSGSEQIDLGNMSLQYVSSNGDFAAVKKKNFDSGHGINPSGTFIIGMNCHADALCDGVDMSWSQSLNNTAGTVFLVKNKEKITEGNDADIIDAFSY